MILKDYNRVKRELFFYLLIKDMGENRDIIPIDDELRIVNEI